MVVPPNDPNWPRRSPSPGLAAVIEDIRTWETKIPVDLAAFKLDENAVEYAEGPHAAIVGPMPPRGPATGVLVRNGMIEGSWGTPERPDIAFSVSKGALSTIAGLAVAEGRIRSLNETVSKSVPVPAFIERPNDTITWRHLLTLTSEWRGSMWGIPDSIDWNRRVPRRPDDPQKGSPREVHVPGAYWEFNDVRVNVLAFALTHIFGENLDDVLRRAIMLPIGASKSWQWHGLSNAAIESGGRRIPVVTGGAHWGGGLIISSFDLARLGLLYNRRGLWNGVQVLPDSWFDMIRVPSLNPSFGLMWWNNSEGALPGASRNAIWGSGIGNLFVMDPDRDIVLVLRWYDVPRRDLLLTRLFDAIDAERR